MIVRVLLMLAALALFPQEAFACAGCRNPSMPATQGSLGELAPGSWRAGATLSATNVHVVHTAGCADLNNCAEVPVQPEYLHDQNITPMELRLFGEYALGGLFGLELQLPFRAVRTSIRYETPSGDPTTPLAPGIHHRNETVVGLADPWLLLRVGQNVGDFWLAARPGLTVPLGSTEENPFELGDQGLRHQHVQLGSGTFDPLLLLEASTALGSAKLDAFTQAQTTLYENSHGYQAPTRLYAGAHVGTDLFTDFGASVGPEISHEDAERWNGEIRQDGLLGRTELLGALRLGYTLGQTELSLSVRVPLWRRLIEGSEPAGKLENPLIVSLGIVQFSAP